jgi:hypothetical protein
MKTLERGRDTLKVKNTFVSVMFFTATEKDGFRAGGLAKAGKCNY